MVGRQLSFEVGVAPRGRRFVAFGEQLGYGALAGDRRRMVT